MCSPPSMMSTARAQPPVGPLPPYGRRSSGGGQYRTIWRASTASDYRHTIDETMLVVLMLETPTAVANAFDIANVARLDVVIVGNNDLSQFFAGFAQDSPNTRPLITRIHADVKRGRQDLRPGLQFDLRQGSSPSATTPSSPNGPSNDGWTPPRPRRPVATPTPPRKANASRVVGQVF